MFNISECTVRLALPQDKTGLIDISRHIWGGTDYLPQIVDRWIAEPWFYVCEYRGKVIACLKLSKLPDNVLWFEGLRVHKDFQGKGVAKLMNSEMMLLAKRLRAHDPLLRFEFCTYYKNIGSMALTSKLGSVQVEAFYSLTKCGVHRTAKPEFIKDIDESIFNYYPNYLPLNWQVVHSKQESLEYISQNAVVFQTPHSRYLMGRIGDPCITFLQPPTEYLKEDLPYFQYFFGARKHISVILNSGFKSYLPFMYRHKFFFWGETSEEALNMLVFTLP
ncbi:MAG: GNAT family N-acetyltransferase [Candidatus Cloacimonetes bacterium]|jgi:GNAT superfamily N-acetyltransferase|nr:GNAT family N-acetyltransferase [Candidatus Cloacimonadota bacterium]MDD2505972.1 GNAT family N-acetyltransferase [Candidatus Cloacimonadota bacterium]MDD4147452.1 GNAT family N-acetyltransferase [Candidatus Cloacimonadota bacterium]MDD4559272.1 GNAT family N-acetyltransferase [Candidatus Cloacimonadota bacterium]